MARFVRQGDIYTVNLGSPYGSEQGGIRPCIVVSNQKCCAFSDVIYIVPLTSQIKTDIPEHYILNSTFLECDNNIVLREQCRPIDKRRLIQKIGYISSTQLEDIIQCIYKNFKI